ncbi:MAG TPA: MATE family efflux transporter [Clostridia bacterium]|nr:MATE family efflux transporter [Clostridia bacterium]
MANKPQDNRLGTEPILPLLFKLAAPSILSMFIQSMYNVVDSIFVARLSEDALAALSLAFPIQMVQIAVAVGTGVGASSLISRSLGRGSRREAERAASHVLLLALVYGAIAAFIGVFFPEQLIGMFTDDPLLIDYGTRYIWIILVGATAMYIPMIANSILRGEGNTFIPMVTMLIGSIMNIILDPLFIFGYGVFPRMGIEGAAVATVLSRIISGSFIVYMLFKGSNQVKVSFRKFKFDFSVIKDIYQVGFPAVLMQVLASVMVGGLNKILAGYSSTAIAAMGIYFRLQSFVFMPVFGLNHGYLPIVGYNFGYNNSKRVKEAMKAGFLTGFAFTVMGFAIFQLFPEQLIMLFGDSPELMEIGVKALRIISLAFPVIGPAIVGGTTFQAVGKGMPSLILSFSRQIIILLPLAFLLGRIGGLDLIWYAFPVAELIAVVWMAVWLKSTMKTVFRIMESDV